MQEPRASLLKWLPVGQICPVAYLKVVNGRALIKNRPHTRVMYLSSDPLILGKSCTSFNHVSSAYTKWPHFFGNLKMDNFNTFWQFYGRPKINQFWGIKDVFDVSEFIWNFELSHTKSPHFWLGPHRILFFFKFLYWQTRTFVIPRWAYSEHLDLPHFSRNNLGLARN